MCDALKLFGVGFVKHLAECFILADQDNLRRLENAFPEYCAKYLAIAKEDKDRLGIDYDIGAGG